jgi:hypothetical protein
LGILALLSGADPWLEARSAGDLLDMSVLDEHFAAATAALVSRAAGGGVMAEATPDGNYSRPAAFPLVRVQ